MLLFCAACGDDGGDDSGGNAGSGGQGIPCATGTSFECFNARCPGNARQFCGADGFLTACTCRDGMGGTGGGGGPADDGGTTDASTPDDASQSMPDAATGDGGQSQPDGAVDGAVPVEEDCDNDRDDDGDGDADCADDDCSARTCVARAPDGWHGPVLVYEGEDAPPDCDGAYPDAVIEGGTALEADPADCSTCTCSGAASSCASFLNFEFGTDDECNGACTNAVNSSCAVLSPSCLSGQTTGYVENKLPPGGGGGCTPSAQTPTVPSTSWTENALACAPDRTLARAGCGSGQLCAPRTPFAGELCIYRQGDVACPDGPYDDRRVYYTAINDSRSCSACECTADCDYTWFIYDAADTSCTTPVVTLGVGELNQCVPVSPANGTVVVGVSIPGAAAGCDPSGGQPTGGVQAEDPVTVCCD